MTPQQILTKAIEKAIANGWEPNDGEHTATDFLNVNPGDWKYAGMKQSIPWLIFNHDFAKALWSETEKEWFDGGGSMLAWQYHLQQMVLADDPIKYLGEHVD